jgi:hypothetical protein
MKNTKSLIEEAKKFLKLWEAEKSTMRSYDGDNWHCVNVKRGGKDWFNFEELLKKYPKRYHKEIKDNLLDGDNIKDYIYYSWLEIAWEDLNDNGVLDEMELKYINKIGKVRYDDRRYIVSCGRSGGWACFQSDGFEIEDELLGQIELEEINADYILELRLKLEGCLNEIARVKRFIDNSNKRLNWEYEITGRIESIIEEEKGCMNNATMIIPKLVATENMLNEFLDTYTTPKHKAIKEAVARSFGSIKAVAKKELK